DEGLLDRIPPVDEVLRDGGPEARDLEDGGGVDVGRGLDAVGLERRPAGGTDPLDRLVLDPVLVQEAFQLLLAPACLELGEPALPGRREVCVETPLLLELAELGLEGEG